MQLLWERGAAKDTLSTTGETPLHLVLNGACLRSDLLRWVEHTKDTRMKASELDLIDVCCEYCPEWANSQDIYGDTPLHRAAAAGFPQAVVLLLRSGSDPCLAN